MNDLLSYEVQVCCASGHNGASVVFLMSGNYTTAWSDGNIELGVG